MKIIAVFLLTFLISCGMLPELSQEFEHVIDDTAICQKISIEALQKGTNVRAIVEVLNSKDDFTPTR